MDRIYPTALSLHHCFDVTSLSTNALLDFLIDVILKHIYDQNDANTNILK